MGKAYDPFNGFFLFHGKTVLFGWLLFLSADHGIQVLQYGLFQENALGILGHYPKISAVQLIILKGAEVFPLQINSSFIGLMDTAKKRQRSTLSCSVSAYKGVEFSLFYF